MGQGNQRGWHARRVTMSRRLAAALQCSLALLVGLAPQADAQIYECTDARGAREFAQVCAAGTVRQRQLLRTDEIPATAGDAKSSAQLDAEFRKRQAERRESEAKALEERTKREDAQRNCMMARTQLKALLEGQRMERIDADSGARINLDDTERAADAEQQKALITRWCT